MTIREYVSKQHQQMKDKTPRERWEYFLDYYKWPALAFILVIAILIQGTISLINRKDTVFSAVIVNSVAEEEDHSAFLQKYYDFAEIDPKKEEAQFYTSIAVSGGKAETDVSAFQNILAIVANKGADFISGNLEAFTVCAYNTSNMLCDLRNYVDAETLAKLEDRIFYIDDAVARQMRDAISNPTAVPVLPDPRDPGAMQEPIPFGIDVSDCQVFTGTYYPAETEVYLGIVSNTTHPEKVLQFIDFILP